MCHLFTLNQGPPEPLHSGCHKCSPFSDLSPPSPAHTKILASHTPVHCSSLQADLDHFSWQSGLLCEHEEETGPGVLPTTISSQTVPLPKLQTSIYGHLLKCFLYAINEERAFRTLRGKVERDTHIHTCRLKLMKFHTWHSEASQVLAFCVLPRSLTPCLMLIETSPSQWEHRNLQCSLNI